jgi:hypothetical protein
MSPLGWFKIGGAAAAVLIIWLTYTGITGWLRDNEAARIADAETISEQAAEINTLNNEVREAADALIAARKAFADNVEKLEKDLRVVTAARDAAIRRSKSFDREKNEVANAPDVEDRPASPVLVRSVDSVRGLLRGRSPIAEDRMAGEGGRGGASDQSGAVRGHGRTGFEPEFIADRD